ncbi:MAG: hypothetical protein FJ211_07845 [Ignavibacteria bacterium]|nr:hypothetical protein [Ignavibacteria bacterium]
MKNRLHLVLIAVILFIAGSCQVPFSPEDLTVGRTVTVEVIKEPTTPVKGASVAWQKLTGASAPLGGVVRTGNDGSAEFTVPNVSLTRDTVGMVVTMPPDPDLSGIDPIRLQYAVCNDTTITLRVQPVIACGTLNYVDSFAMQACPAEGADEQKICKIYPTNCPAGVTFTASASTSGPFTITTTATGTTQSILELCVTYRPPAGAAAGSVDATSFTVRGTNLSGTTVFLLTATAKGTVNCSTCECPVVPDTSDPLGTYCVNTTIDTVISLSKLLPAFNLDAGCEAEFELVAGSTSVFDPEARFVLRGGQKFPDLAVRITPTQTGQFSTTLRYSVTVRNLATDKTQQCPDELVIGTQINVITGSCQIVRRQVGPLRKCVYNDSSTVDSIEIRNTGRCLITINATSKSALFTVSPGSLQLAAGQTRYVYVRFAAQRRDWDANPMQPRGALGEKDFRGQIEIAGCDLPSSIDVDGIATVQCNTFKYQCLRQFRPLGYESVYAESVELLDQKAQILYQNDNQRFQVFDIYAQSISQVGGAYAVTLASGSNLFGQAYGVFYRVATGFSVLPGQNICDTYPVLAQTICGNAKSGVSSGTQTLSGLQQGDVILYVKQGSNGKQCALIWIQSIGPDRPGSVALPQVCLEICHRVFNL